MQCVSLSITPLPNDYRVLPDQYLSEDAVGGPTAHAHLQRAVNLRHMRRFDADQAQFGMAVIEENELRGKGTLQMEKLNMLNNGFEKIRIKIRGVDIFKEGPMDLHDTTKTNLMM